MSLGWHKGADLSVVFAGGRECTKGLDAALKASPFCLEVRLEVELDKRRVLHEVSGRCRGAPRLCAEHRAGLHACALRVCAC